MKLQFKHQAFQADAANAVCDVFAGQPFRTPTYMIDSGIGQMTVSQMEWISAFLFLLLSFFVVRSLIFRHKKFRFTVRKSGFSSNGNPTGIPSSLPIISEPIRHFQTFENLENNRANLSVSDNSIHT